jgi:hypothetical protein
MLCACPFRPHPMKLFMRISSHPALRNRNTIEVIEPAGQTLGWCHISDGKGRKEYIKRHWGGNVTSTYRNKGRVRSPAIFPIATLRLDPLPKQICQGPVSVSPLSPRIRPNPTPLTCPSRCPAQTLKHVSLDSSSYMSAIRPIPKSPDTKPRSPSQGNPRFA